MSRKGEASLPAIRKALKKHDIHVDDIFEINRDNDVATVCKRMLAQNPGLIVMAGGDGTVSSALHHLANCAIDIGIIPLGTTNNFARSLRVPLDIDEAAEYIADKDAQPVDMGVVNGQYFANVVGVGLSTTIAQSVSDKLKKRFGRLAYAMVGLQQLFKHRAFHVTISDKDKELAFDFETHQVIIANGRYHAGKKIAADVAVDNRELVIFALGGRGWLSFLWHTLDFYLGRRKKIIHGSYMVGNHVTLSTSRPQSVEVDGEPGIQTPLDLQVRSGVVMVRH